MDNQNPILRRIISKYKKDGMSDLAKSIYRHLNRQTTGRVRPAYQYILYKILYGKAGPNPWHLIYINPCKINYKLVPNFRTRLGKHIGTYILDGEWDKKEAESDILDKVRNNKESYADCYWGLVSLDQHFFFKSVKDRFVNSLPWEETELYRVRVSNRGMKYARKECEKLDKLYKRIKNEGYQLQSELNKEWKKYPHPSFDEIRINIGRNGRLIFDDGRHRLAIARILGIEEVPVRVFVRHTGWQRTRENIHNSDISIRDEELRSHPDLQDVFE